LTPLLKAIELSDEKAVKLLLDYKANPNIRMGRVSYSVAPYDMRATDIFMDHQDENEEGDPALVMACKLRLVGIVKLLLDKNADVTLKDKVSS
jgi:ankyrin repeat protein